MKLRRDAWRWLKGMPARDAALLRHAAKSGFPIDSAEDIGNGLSRVWFARSFNMPGFPAVLSARPWMVPAQCLEVACPQS